MQKYYFYRKPIYHCLKMKIPHAVLLFLLIAQSVFCQNSPKELTTAFIKDYKKWNDSAFRLGNTKTANRDELISKSYGQLIAKYCQPGKKHQPIAYGSDSNHSMEQESIVDEKVIENKAIITTNFKNIGLEYFDTYEYHFIKVKDKWFLEEVYFVDNGNKYEGL